MKTGNAFFKIMLCGMLILFFEALVAQNVFHHAQAETSIPLSVQMGYEIQVKNVGFAAHFGLVPKKWAEFSLDLQSAQDPSVQQRNAFIKSGLTNGSTFDMAIKYYLKPKPNTFYISILSQFPTFNVDATLGDYLKNLGINSGAIGDKALVQTSFRMILVGITVGKRFKITQNLAFQAELGASYNAEQNPSVPIKTTTLLQENLKNIIQSKMEAAIAESQKSSVLPTLKMGLNYTF